jgi:hypothetical protein
LALSFAQLTARESLRDIEINLRVQRQHFYHLGFRCKTISRNTLATRVRQLNQISSFFDPSALIKSST